MEKTGITTGTKLKAWVCRLCPVCIVARRYPDSGLSRKVRAMEKDCPFCRAYQRIKAERPPNS